jgi:DNA-binding NarL/FixJ family response regulator
MSRRQKKIIAPEDPQPGSVSLSDDEWNLIVSTMNLTCRQAEIVALLMRGYGDKDIATSLGIGFSTVRTHLRQVFAKQNVDDRLQLVLRAFALLRRDLGRSIPP